MGLRAVVQLDGALQLAVVVASQLESITSIFFKTIRTHCHPKKNTDPDPGSSWIRIQYGSGSWSGSTTLIETREYLHNFKVKHTVHFWICSKIKRRSKGLDSILHFFLNTWGSIKTLRRGENTQGVVQGPSALAGSPWYSEQWKKLYLGGRGWVWKLPRPVAGWWRSASWPYLTPRGEKLVSCEQKLLISDQWVELSHLNWYI